MYLIEILGLLVAIPCSVYVSMPPMARTILNWNIRIFAPTLTSKRVFGLGVFSYILGKVVLELPLPSFTPELYERAAENDHSALLELAPALFGRIVGIGLLIIVPMFTVGVVGWRMIQVASLRRVG